jgi:hypothetical protein
MPRYLNTHDFVCDIFDPVLDMVIVADFECQITVELAMLDGQPNFWCDGVYLDGQSLKGGSELSRLIRLKVMEAADEELANGGPLWDAVAAREGVAFIGPAGSPDAHWARA